MRAAARPRTPGQAWLNRRYVTRRLYTSVHRRLVSLPVIRLPLGTAPAPDDLAGLGMGSCQISVSRRMCEAVVVVIADGDLDLDSSRLLDAKLQDILAAGNLCRLVIDLTRVGFLSDAGLHSLLRAHDKARAVGIPLRVVTGDSAAGAVLDLCDFRSRLPSAPDVDTACAM